MKSARSVYCLVTVALWTLLLLPVQSYALLLHPGLARRLPSFYHRGVSRILGLRIEVIGERWKDGATLYAVNHSSWLDIIVLSAVIPGSFVAKQEVAGWPGVGLLAKLQRSVFIVRKARHSAEHRDEMVSRLESGDNLILFPEGTSSDGNRVLPFKSSFFGVAEKAINGAPLPVQPMSVAYTRLGHLPLGRHMRPYFTWYGDMELGGHLWEALGLGPVTAVVQFHPVMTIATTGTRKIMSARCEAVVREGVSNALAGRARSAVRPAPDVDVAATPAPISPRA